MKFIYITILMVLISGCSTTLPPMTEYRINAKIDTKGFSDLKGCKEKSIKVAQAFSASSLMSQNMSYGLGQSKQFAYSQAQWADVPNRALTTEVVKLLRNLKVFKNVQLAKSRSKSDLILETYIEDFQQYFNEDSTQSHVRVVISFSILDTVSSEVVASETFSSQLDVKSLDALGGVEALNIALSEVLNESASWFGGVCK